MKKLEYHKPNLKVHGSIKKLTKGTVKGGIETGGYRNSTIH